MRRSPIALALAVACFGLIGIACTSSERRSSPVPSSLTDEQAVIVHFRLSDDGFGSADERRVIMTFGDAMRSQLSTSLGFFDGDEFGGGWAVVYFYGPDADRLADLIRPHLPPARTGSYLVRRHGEPGARELREDIGDGSD